MVQNSEKLTTVVENSNEIKEKFLGHNLNNVDSNCNGVNNKLILDSASNRSSIKSFYQNACILVTGGTGFLGKVLLEKLLRSCDSLRCIYVLMRPKRGLSSEQRHRELVENPIFDRIRNDHPERLNKIIFIAGDLSEANLGVSVADMNLLKETVNIVFHSAAAVRFDQVINEAIELNTLSTKRLWDLCLEMRNLKSVIHVSTAYTNATRRYVGETIYPPKVAIDPNTFLKCADILPQNLVSMIAKQLYGKHPNTYTVTKAIAEQISADYYHRLPITIIRPSVITCSMAEPYPGWIDNINALTGFIAEFGRGSVSSVMCDSKLVIDLIPVDIVCNAMITAAWLNYYKPSNNIRVYNCTSGSLNPIGWRMVRRHILHYCRLYPTKHVMMFPGYANRSNRFVHFFYDIFLHRLPAILYDFILQYNGKRPIMVKIAKRYKRAAETCEFFMRNEFNFDVKNVSELLDEVDAADDGDEFCCDIKRLDWDSYFKDYWCGVRKYIFKDDLSTLDGARWRVEMLYVLKLIVQTIFSGAIAFIFYKLFFQSKF